MANRTYLPSSHRLLSGYPTLTSPRNSVSVSSRGSPPSPEFSYDVYPRDPTRGGTAGRDVTGSYNRTPTSPGNSAIGMAYSSVQDFPYGLSGVQMPTYNFGSELYNYVSNGFPRKSRMCTFCNKVFTRSTTRRYHERRCPLLRASNSLAKNEENNSASSASLNAMKEQQAQQRQKESSGGGRGLGHHNSLSNSSSLPRILSSSITNTTTAQSGVLTSQTSPPLPSLHPAYPSFPKSSAMAVASNSSRSSAYSYPHPYSSHFYNSLSAAALASLDQNNKKHESDTHSWSSSTSPPSTNKLQDQVNSFGSKLNSSLSGSHLSKAFTPEAVVDLTARYCADFSLRTRPPVFPAPSFRAPPHSPPSPEPGETKLNHQDEKIDCSGRESPLDAVNVVSSHAHSKLWPNSHQESKTSSYNNAISSSSSSLEVEGYRRQNSSPLSESWPDKDALDTPRHYMKVEPLDEEDEEEFEDEEDEDEVEEDEEQFKIESLDADGVDVEIQSLNYKGTQYNPLVCHFCKENFPDIITRKAHEALHAQKKLFACCLCSHSFHCAYSLRIHTLRHHKGGPYKCKYCFTDYGPPSAMRTHLIKEHSLPKTEIQSLKYLGLLTNSTSSSPNSMLNNAVSEGEHDEIAKSNDFKHHRRSADHHSSPYAYSSESSKALLSPSKIPAMNGKSGAEEETELCKVCNKSFSKSYIRLHERAHADQKPYECPICNKRFGYKNNMKSHMKLHQGLKPYQCQICGARFTRGSTLRRHGRRHSISHSAMLDYVLYDQHGGRGAAAAAAAAAAAVGLGHKLSMVPTSTQGAKGQYVLPSQNNVPPPQVPLPHPTTADPSTAITTKHSAFGSMPSLIPATVANGLDKDKFKQRSPPHHSPTHHLAGNSPRVTSSHYSSHNSITNPMVGGLAAVAAANLFAYPNAAAAAPHLYQFYASNPLMAYSPYSTNPNTQSVQSDALNLSINKRKSEERLDSKSPIDCKQPRIDTSESVVPSQRHNGGYTFPDSDVAGDVKVEVEPSSREGFESSGGGDHDKNPHISTRTSRNGSCGSPPAEQDFKIESAVHNGDVDDNDKNVKTLHSDDYNHPIDHYQQNHQQNHLNNKDNHHQQQLKVSTEDFGTQVNICCPSPQVQSSTGYVHQSSCNNSPVGSSSGPDGHLHNRASPSGVSGSSSPVNSAPSPTNPNDSSQDLLLSLLSSGRLFRCSFCDIYFTEYAMFRLHQKYHQSDMARPFLCAVCGEDCKDKTYFTVHLSEHLGLGPKAGLP